MNDTRGRSSRQRVVLTRLALILLVFLAVAALGFRLAGSGASVPVVHAQEGEVQTAEVAKHVPLRGIKQVVVGGYHSCAIAYDGRLTCWGNNFMGQLGDNHSQNWVPFPMQPIGMESGVKMVAMGENHTCTLMDAGNVYCWGANNRGQIGIGSANLEEDVPVEVTALGSSVEWIGAGKDHTCAVMNDGSVRCWGSDQSGQLGNGGSNVDSSVPLALPGLAGGVAKVYGGYAHTCAITTAGAALCWGDDTAGQLGDSAVASSSGSPVPVSGLTSGVIALAAGGAFNCALQSSGALSCWGDDSVGQMGNGLPLSNSFVPLPMPWFDGMVKEMAAGYGHLCVATIDGNVRCWGWDGNGQLGNGSPSENQSTTTDIVSFESEVSTISGGYAHTCTSHLNGEVMCWGSDQAQGLGNGPSFLSSFSPGKVITPAICYELTISSNGTGTIPVASPVQSDGCPINHFLTGEQITFLAAPTTNQRVDAWVAPISGAPGQTVASLKMPAQDSDVFMNYAACNALTVSHTGSGGDPVAAPSSSAGCASGRYVLGEKVVVNVVPAASNRVKSWSGTTATPAVGSQVNSFSMPAGAYSVAVVYEPCFTLTLSMVGQGAPLSLSPAASDGCLTGGFAAGQSISLVASAAAGWRIAGWTGTANDGSTLGANSATMPAASKAISVRYEQIVNGQPTATPTVEPGVTPTSTPPADGFTSFLPTVGR